MRNNISDNYRQWNDVHSWTQDGDEWTQMADYDGQPYAAWKRSLIEAFILPQLTPQTRVLEIAPGRGRWSATLVERAGHVTLVDLSDACVAACQARFAGASHVSYFVNDGRSLPVGDESQDFVLSIDSFLHMPEEVIVAYLSEIFRVLVPGGQAVLHHADRRHATLHLGWLMRVHARRLYSVMSQGRQAPSDGWRSNVSRRIVARRAVESGLRVLSQESVWGDHGQYSVNCYRDRVTTLQKPA